MKNVGDIIYAIGVTLTSSPEHPQPLRVVAAATKSWVERLGAVWVEGQAIEIKRRASVTQFLTLRDKVDDISITVTTTAAVLDAAGALPEGALVAAWIKPQMWAASGRLSFECRQIRPLGEGQLLAEIEQRKRILQAAGLFDPSLKRPLPFLPRKIGLITGAGSAAEKDVLENVRNRWPAATFEIRHTLVQGPNAAAQICEALAILDEMDDVDVIAISRGGGSLEDLLPFSDESLVRAVHQASTPVVSAIGHESDTPILDLVADLRASTPTDAAKRIVPDARVENESIRNMLRHSRRAISNRVEAELRWLADIRNRPLLRNPLASVYLQIEQIAELRQRSVYAINAAVAHEGEAITNLLNLTRSLSPEATLARGYAILSKGSKDIASTRYIKAGDELTARLHNGSLRLTVTAKEKK